MFVVFISFMCKTGVRHSGLTCFHLLLLRQAQNFSFLCSQKLQFLPLVHQKEMFPLVSSFETPVSALRVLTRFHLQDSKKHDEYLAVSQPPVNMRLFFNHTDENCSSLVFHRAQTLSFLTCFHLQEFEISRNLFKLSK